LKVLKITKANQQEPQTLISLLHPLPFSPNPSLENAKDIAIVTSNLEHNAIHAELPPSLVFTPPDGSTYLRWGSESSNGSLYC